ncbi:uncharacterized protein DUF547 [Nonlabens ulvanivorans]|nr:DUF547 domain-containing protein [Nonlabens ulvanivorans]GAK91918.1 uncharacterized protein DUF547 [Nonlabens ulvanivorans]
MKFIYSIISLFILSSCVGGKDLNYTSLNSGEQITDATSTVLDHQPWDNLLKKYVDDKGFVDYKAFKKDHHALNEYLQYLNTNAPTKTTSINEQFAYYINLYNAATVDLILENDMPASIKDISGPLGQVWLVEHVMINDKAYSLAAVEKNVLQKMGDPRIHFAINCASFSCPKLQNTAFTAANLNSLMDKAAAEFINSDKNDLSDVANPRLSKIFDWYKSDFTDTGVTIIEYINKYANSAILKDASISYKDYDWSLNKQ